MEELLKLKRISQGQFEDSIKGVNLDGLPEKVDAAETEAKRGATPKPGVNTDRRRLHKNWPTW